MDRFDGARRVLLAILGLTLPASGCGDEATTDGSAGKPTHEVRRPASVPAEASADAAAIDQLIARFDEHLRADDARSVHALLSAPLRQAVPPEEFQTIWRTWTDNAYYGRWKRAGSVKGPPVVPADTESGERLVEVRLVGQTEKAGTPYPIEVRVLFAMHEGTWGIHQIEPVSTPPRVPVTVRRQTPEEVLDSFVAAAREADADALGQVLTAEREQTPAQRARSAFDGRGHAGRFVTAIRDDPARQMYLRYFLGKLEGGPATLPTGKPDPMLAELQRQGATEARVYFLMVDDPDRPNKPRGVSYLLLGRFDDGWRIDRFIPFWSAK